MAENDGPKKPAWADKELAFAINLIDKCLVEELHYNDVAEDELSKFEGHERHLKGIKTKLKRWCAQHELLDPSTPDSKLYEKGTSVLDIRKIPAAVLEQMEDQRKDMHLPPLFESDPVPEVESNTMAPAVEKESIINVEQRLADPLPIDLGLRADQLVPSKRVHSSSRNTYADDANASSPPSAYEDANDGDWANKEDKKRAKKRTRKSRPIVPETPYATDTEDIQMVGDHDDNKALEVSVDTATMEDHHDENIFHTPLSAQEQVHDESSMATSNKMSTPSTMKSPNNISTQAVRNETPLGTPVQQQSPGPIPLLNGTNQIAFHHPTTPQPQSAYTPGPLPTDLTELMGIVKNLAWITGVLAKQHMQKETGATEEQISRRWISIERTLWQNPGNIKEDLLRMLSSTEARNTTLTNHLTTLIGRHDPQAEMVFPKIPDRGSIDDSWQNMQKYIHEAIGFDVTEPAFKYISCGFIAARIEDLTRVDGQKIGMLPDYNRGMAMHLRSPHAVRALLGALMIRWLFASEEPMCQGPYACGEKELAIYTAKLQTVNGVAEIQKDDKIGMQALFASPDFQQGAAKDRAAKLLVRLANILKNPLPNASKYAGFAKLKDIEEWSMVAVKLKQTLMISPQDYRVHFCQAGTRFDATWMTAEDKEGLPVSDAKAKGKGVAICLFPALSERKPAAFPKDVNLDDILVANKRFLPTDAEIRDFDPKNVIAKATVLVTAGPYIE